MLKIVRLKHYDGFGAEVSLDFIFEQLEMTENNYEVQLFEVDQVVKLDIPFSEVYHRCTKDEWNFLCEYIDSNLGDSRMKR